MACRLFTGITPMNVWDIPWVYWQQGFAPFVDEYVAAMREGVNTNG